MSRGQLGQPVGLLRQISRVFGMVKLRKRKITLLVYNFTFSFDEMERVCMYLSTTISPSAISSAFTVGFR